MRRASRANTFRTSVGTALMPAVLVWCRQADTRRPTKDVDLAALDVASRARDDRIKFKRFQARFPKGSEHEIS
jgi:hypothetical protein